MPIVRDGSERRRNEKSKFYEIYLSGDVCEADG